MPTLAAAAQVPNPGDWTFRGVNLMPVILDASQNPTQPTVKVQDSVLFTFDDENVGMPCDPAEPCEPPQQIVKQPNHIRSVRTSHYKYAVYFDPQGTAEPQYELYDLQTDPTELHNMARPDNTAYYNPQKVNEMHLLLNEKLTAAGLPPLLPRVFIPLVGRGA